MNTYTMLSGETVEYPDSTAEVTNFLALVGVIRNKRVTWKTTPKGDASDQEEDRLRVFAPHFTLSLILLAGMGFAFLLGHTTWVFLAWGCVTASLMAAFTVGQLCWRAFAALRWKRAPIAQPEAVN